MVEEINKKWLHVSIERGGKETHNEEYYKGFETEFGVSKQAVAELESLLIDEFEQALFQAYRTNKRHLEIKLNY